MPHPPWDHQPMKTHELFQQISQADAWQQLSQATQTKYLVWIRRYTEFLRQDNVAALSAQEKISQFLIRHAMYRSSNTKRQAVAAITWVYRHILHEDIAPPRVKIPRSIPHLFSKQHVALELSKLPIRYQFMGWLCYGSGLTLHETVTLKHEQMISAQIHLPGRTLPSPLCRQAIMLYAALKQPDGYVFPSKRTPEKPMTNTLFLHACRSHGVERRITPGALRANFILMAIESHGIPWTQAVSGLSSTRLAQYIEMIPPKVKRPLDALGG